MQYINIAAVTACKCRYYFVYKNVATLATVCEHQYHHWRGVYWHANVVATPCKCVSLCSNTMIGIKLIIISYCANLSAIICKCYCMATTVV